MDEVSALCSTLDLRWDVRSAGGVRVYPGVDEGHLFSVEGQRLQEVRGKSFVGGREVCETFQVIL